MNNIEFTFGIITSGTEDDNINKIIDSIEKQNIPTYEIIIVGNSKVSRKKTRVIQFNDKHIPKWITRKKNIITNVAKFENIVYLHDYVILTDDWYKSFLEFGNDFDLCMSRITNHDGTRYRDWCICMWDNPTIMQIAGPDKKCILPYDENRFKKHMYFSGAYWVAKKQVMLKYPLNEQLIWGQGEDVLWSRQVREKYEFFMNANSEVKLLKQKEVAYGIADQETIQKLSIVLT
jgi:hypothetical protein